MIRCRYGLRTRAFRPCDIEMMIPATQFAHNFGIDEHRAGFVVQRLNDNLTSHTHNLLDTKST
jgi:hypothetical protein